MRLLLPLGLLLAAGLVGLFVISGRESTRSHPAGIDPEPERSLGAADRPTGIGVAGAEFDRLLESAALPPADAQQALRAFVANQVGLGAQAVPGLLAFLRGGKDARSGPAWKLSGATLQGDFPTVRAAVIMALSRIPGPEATRALSEAFEGARGIGETYLLAAELRRRGQTGWEERLLDLSQTTVTRRDISQQEALVKLAARFLPAQTARRILDEADRGPGPVAHALKSLPAKQAEAAGRQLLANRDLPLRTKRVYIELLLARPEPEFVAIVREAWRNHSIPPSLRKRLLEALKGREDEAAVAFREELAQ